MRRDAFGQRPLHLDLRRQRPASSVWDLAPAGLAPAAVVAYLLGELPPAASLFEGIGRVPPGHEFQGGELRAWWSWPRPGLAPLLPELEAAARQTGRCAVALSGGLDSGCLLALAARAGLVSSAFTVVDGLDDGGELARARASARHAGVPLVEIEVEAAELPDLFPEAVLAAGEPLWNGRGVARLAFYRRLAAAAERDLPVLSGVGADELLLGDAEGLRAGRRRQAREAELARSLLRGEVDATPTGTLPGPQDARREAVLRLLPESTLPPECRLSLASGIEVVLPFLADGPASAALGIPEADLVRGVLGKWPLREASAGLVPEELRLLPKTPRLAPPGGGTRRARRRWLELLDACLQPARLERLPVDAAAVRGALARLATEAVPGDRAALDALLLRLAGLSVLDAACRGARPFPAPARRR